MKNIFSQLVMVTLLVSNLVACSKTNSSNVKTKGMYVTFEVRGNNLNQAECLAQFQVGGPTGTYLELDGSDQVTCDGQLMAKSELLGMVTYSANVAYQVGKTYKIDFSREGENLYESTATLPNVIATINPTSGAQIQKGTGITVSWTSDTDPLTSMGIYLSYSAQQNSSKNYTSHSLNDSAPENGVLGFAANDTVVNPMVTGPWPAEMTFTRKHVGALASGLQGTMQGTQKKIIPFTLID